MDTILHHDSFIFKKKKQIQESTILLEKMVCKSEALDHRLDEQKRELNLSLERMKEIQRLLEETDCFLAEQAKKMEEYKKETEHRRQRQILQSEDLLRIVSSPSFKETICSCFESAPVEEYMCC
jgi:hypothetical protein